MRDSLGKGIYFQREKDSKEDVEEIPEYESSAIQAAKEKLAKELGILPENITIKIEV